MNQLFEVELEKECPYGIDEKADKQVLLDLCKENIENYDEKIISRSFDLCLMAHRNVFRSSGVPYYTHPLKVAIILIKEMGYGDNALIAAAMLHDVVEDNKDYPLEYVEDQFGSEIAQIVNGVTKIKGINTRQLDKVNTYVKLFEALINDVRVVFIKLADRLDNLRTLEFLPKYKQQYIADETLNFYVPFAQRLGLIKIKRILEILAFYFKDPEAYENIRQELDKKRMELLNYIKKFHDAISENLEKKAIPHIITIEHKHPYEIYKISKEKNIPVSDIQDFYSMVVILRTDDITECYKAYGVIANIFGPVSSLVDYIARPKINFYRALHSTHFGPDRRLVDVIIRTEEMDNIAEKGIALKFKSGKKDNPANATQSHKLEEDDANEWLKWMKDIIEDNEDDAILQIWGSIRMNQYEEEINVTCKNISYRLPKGACAIDLAFKLGKEIGYHCISAKINGEIKPLNLELKDNDNIEIITSPNSLPLEDWENHVVTHNAIVQLYYYFKSRKNITKKIEPEPKPAEPKLFKFRIIGNDRQGIVKDITEAVGQINIMRINLSLNNNADFEGAFTLSIPEDFNPNIIYAKLIGIKDIKMVEQLPEDEIMI